ncbi:MAG: hypothetical protein ACI8RZ_003259 [Myxococcota bacterium]|jgi:uncharacterized protein YuzE
MLSAAIVLSGCQPELSDVIFTPGSVGTVVQVTWESSVEGAGEVVYDTETDTLAVPAVVTQDNGTFRYTADLIGLRSDSPYEATLRVLLDDDPVELTTDFRSGALALALPGMTVTGEADAASGYLLTTIMGEPSIGVILDREGQYVWAYADDTPNIYITQIQPDPVNRALVYGRSPSYPPSDSDNTGELIRVSLDGSTVESISAPGFHHDFLIHEDGTIAYIAFDEDHVVDPGNLGDRIVELYPDGSQAVIWSTWDDLEFSASVASQGPGWTHANAIQYDPEADTYYVSLYNMDTIARIDRTSGELDWLLGGSFSDFDQNNETLLNRAHQFQVLESGLLVFNDNDSTALEAELVEISFDEDTMTAEEVWSYDPGGTITSEVLGSVQRLDNGHTIGTFSTSGVIDELDANGDRVWRMESSFGTVLSYTHTLTDLTTILTP